LPDRLAATVLLRELRERGYAGGYTILKDFVAALQPSPAAEPVVRFETAPGQQMQVDWVASAEVVEIPA
jgi:transposase